VSARREVETTDYLGFAKRVIRAAGERTGQGDPFDLGELIALRESVEAAISTAVALQRASEYSWAEIGDGLGISRQAAQQRYAERVSA
jgi:hypothetical protein